MKIAFIVNVDFALYHFIAPLMREARARGHDVVAFCADGPLLAPLRAEGLRIQAVPLVRRLSPLAHARALAALIAQLRAEHPDLVHAHMPISGFLGRLAARIAGVPRIAYTCHGFLFNQPGPVWRRALSLVMEFTAGRMTHIFLTVSEQEASDARRLHIARHPIAIGNGRNPAVFRPDPQARARIRATLGVPDSRPVIIAVSRLVRHKGYPELAAAMRDIDAELWVVGTRLPHDRGADMEALLRAAGLGDRLRLLGYRADVADLLAAADIFTLPSHFEGLPMSIIEAMLTGLPVVATNIRGPREQITDNITGLLVPPADASALAAALTRLVSDAPLRATLGHAARDHALTRYTEADVLSRTLAALGA